MNNPRGVRCTLQDNQANVYGRDRATGFAPAFVDSAGVQYGLAAFNAGKIGAEQFVARIGGFDVDGNVVPKRSRRRSARVADSLSDRPRELDRIKQDNSNDSAAVKVARNKPTGLVDACWTLEGEKIAEPATYDGPGRCNQLYPAFGDPRIAAVAPLANDILKCALKAVTAEDYKQPLSDEQLKAESSVPAGSVGL